MRLTRSSTGLVVRVSPGILVYILGLAALYPLWVLLGEGSISHAQLPGSLIVPPISLALMAFFAEVAEYKFSPITHSLHWWRRSAFGRHEGTVALGDIEEVRVATRQNRDDGYRLHTVAITARGKTIYLGRGLSTGTVGHHAVADAIVEYLEEHGYRPRHVTEEPPTRHSRRPDPPSRLTRP